MLALGLALDAPPPRGSSLLQVANMGLLLLFGGLVKGFAGGLMRWVGYVGGWVSAWPAWGATSCRVTVAAPLPNTHAPHLCRLLAARQWRPSAAWDGRRVACSGWAEAWSRRCPCLYGCWACGGGTVWAGLDCTCNDGDDRAARPLFGCGTPRGRRQSAGVQGCVIIAGCLFSLLLCTASAPITLG